MKIRSSRALTCVTGFAVACAAVHANAQQATPPADDPSGTLQEVVVTGSRIRRSVDDIPSPVTVLGAEDLAATGRATVSDMLKTLPIQAGSMTMSDNLSNIYTSGSNVDLRGLGPASTLVLLNGRRQAVFASPTDDGDTFVDVNSLMPTIMIDRIDIVKDGGSALYGTDAVAGTVNFVTRSNFTGAEMNVRYQTTQVDEDNEDLVISGIVGFGGDRGHAVLAVDYLDRTGFPLRNQKSLANNAFASGLSSPGAYVLLAGRTYNAPYHSLPRGVTIIDPLCGAAELGGQPIAGVPTATPGGPGGCRMLGGYSYTLVPDERRLNAMVTANYDLTEALNTYIEVGYSRDRIQRETSPSFGSGILRTIAAANPGNIFGNDVLWLGRPLGLRHGNAHQAIENDTTRGVWGLRGGWAETSWTWDVATVFSNSRFRVAQPDTLSDRLVAAFNGVGGPNNNQFFNPFGNQWQASPGDPRYNDPAVIADFFVPAVLDAKTSLRTLDFQATGDVFTLPAGSVGLAVGGQLRDETTEGNWDANMNAGRYTLIPQAPDWYGSRDVWGAFFEVAIPVHSAVDLQVAGRYEDYGSDVNAFNPKVAALWRPMNTLSVRASWGRSFRAPGLIQLFGRQSSAESLVLNGRQIAPVVEVVGTESLDPEVANAWSVEVVWDPIADLRLNVAHWNFDIEDIIIRDSPFTIAQGQPCGGGVVVCNALGEVVRILTRFSNAAFLKTNGFDFGAIFRWPSRIGELTFSANGTWVNEYQLRASDTSPVIDGVGSRNWANFGSPQPEWRGSAGVKWALDGHSAALTGRYIDSQVNDVPAAGRPADMASYTTVDLSYSYTLDGLFGGKETTFSIGAVNLLDKLPPIAYGATAAFDTETYDGRGRMIYAEFRHGVH